MLVATMVREMKERITYDGVAVGNSGDEAESKRNLCAEDATKKHALMVSVGTSTVERLSNDQHR